MTTGSRTTTWRAGALVLLLAGVACLILWSEQSSPEHSDQDPSATRTGSAVSTPDGTIREESSGDTLARPVAVSIPTIGVTSALVGLGLNDDGTVEVPANPGKAGWYRLGTRPGAPGSAVILGHVDSIHGPAVFYRLGTLHPGDQVDVRLADGSSVRFRVRSVTVYPNAGFPAEQVYAAGRGRVLNLVTCGGEYDGTRGGYQANVVVNARWMSTTPG
ncbi:MAG: Sortase family protein [Nocardioides sp.]|nr:Sortase family protein [Nocardioides sp.]